MVQTTMKALTIQDRGKVAVVDVELPPQVRSEYVRVKTLAVALNPTDWKHVDLLSWSGMDTIVGCDVAGVVVAIGDKVTSEVKIGDVIAGLVHGSNPDPRGNRDGCFAEYSEIKQGLFARIPQNMDPAVAATFGMGVSTAAVALYQQLGVPLPSNTADTNSKSSSRPQIMIYGAGSATGTIAVQLAKLSGWNVIAVASPHNHAMLRDRGADAVFDYRDPDSLAQINHYTGGKLYHVLDSIGEFSTAEYCLKALSTDPNQKLLYNSLLEVEGITEIADRNVEVSCPSVFVAIGDEYGWPGKQPRLASPKDHKFMTEIWAMTEGLLADGKLKPHPLDIKEGGLDAIAQGLKELRSGVVGAKKRVYILA